jgi:L-rhamnose isomerase
MQNEKLKSYLKKLQEAFPDIRPYKMDDWDFSWADDGYQFLEACDFGMAELTFQRLVTARPRDPDGFEGLAMVYHALGLREWAVLLIDEAIRLARKQRDADLLDEAVLHEMQMEQKQIHAMPENESEQAVMGDTNEDQE